MIGKHNKLVRFVAPGIVGILALTGCTNNPDPVPSVSETPHQVAAHVPTIDERYRNSVIAISGKILKALGVAADRGEYAYNSGKDRTYCVGSPITAMRPSGLGACINPSTGKGIINVVGHSPTVKDGIDSMYIYFDGRKLTNKYATNLDMVVDGADADLQHPLQIVGREGTVVLVDGTEANTTLQGPSWVVEKFGDETVSGSYLPNSPDTTLPAVKIIKPGDATDVAITDSLHRLETQLLPQ